MLVKPKWSYTKTMKKALNEKASEFGKINVFFKGRGVFGELHDLCSI
ncbi:hypothetical protein VCRA2119O48_110097 [Vibrio crassostreae]|nr:hypothetical protein VCRA2119O48_110097 [Vibrio crassostreae]CAK3907027.1 hypothetical protein VCRA212O16_330038 [Vibrio crassostreae]